MQGTQLRGYTVALTVICRILMFYMNHGPGIGVVKRFCNCDMYELVLSNHVYTPSYCISYIL